MYSLNYTIPPELLANPYSHLPHWAALEQLESARRRLYLDAGESVVEWAKRGIFLVVARLNIEFLREIKATEITFYAAEVSSLNKRLCLGHGFRLANGKPAVKVQGEFAFLDSRTKRAIAPDPAFVARLTALVAK